MPFFVKAIVFSALLTMMPMTSPANRASYYVQLVYRVIASCVSADSSTNVTGAKGRSIWCAFAGMVESMSIVPVIAVRM